MAKKCQGCKKTLDESNFKDPDCSKPNHIYSKCNECRLKISSKPKKNHCDICGCRASFNFSDKVFGIKCLKHKSPEMVDVRNKKCQAQGCNKRPYFNKEGISIGIFCIKHKLPDMIDVKSKRCQAQGCNKRPSFNKEGENTGIFCYKHKEAYMINVKTKRCQEKDCNKYPSYNKEGKTSAIFCSEHKEIDMIDVKTKKCQKQGCNKRPYFNKEGEKVGIFCSEHKEKDMIDVKHKRCQAQGCSKQPSFNKEGETLGIFCSDHRRPDMVNIKDKKCKKKGCYTYPVYNKEGESVGIFCFEHKEPCMINVKNKRCQAQGCNKIPVYNKEGESIGIFCCEHKQKDMMNVKDKRCQYKGCNKRPSFNKEDEKKGIFCYEHKHDDMINVVENKCKEKGCRKRAYYAHPNVIPEYCSEHRKVGMIQNPRKKCQGGNDGDCKEVAIYGLENGKPIHCEQHMLQDDYNLAERECVRCKRIDVLNKEGICINFCSMEERDRIMKKRVKKHEEKIGNLLREEIDIPCTYRDEVVDKACSNKRPDFVYHRGTHIVIVEVDEDQHKSYKCTAYGNDKDGKMKGENIRMFEIAQSFDGLPVVFLRYNPDNYRVGGVLGKYAMSKRHDLLVKWVRKCLREKMEGFKVKYLFYDEFEESNGSFMEIKEEDVV